jgi:ribonuclease T1
VVRRRRPRSLLELVLVAAVLLAVVAWTWNQEHGAGTQSAVNSGTGAGSTATTHTALDPETGLPWIEVAALPSQGRAVLASIDKGGPYPYSQDGGTFTNAERLLPLKAKGFYTEYTVKLPSSSDRGPVRIIMGGKGQWYFWTDDHYASFSRIRR